MNFTITRLGRQNLNEITETQVLEPNKHYVRIRVRAVQVTCKRSRGKRIGYLYATVSLPSRVGSVKIPLGLSLGRLNPVDTRTPNWTILGPVPYLSGNLRVQLGLMTFPSSAVLDALVTVIDAMSREAGATFIDNAKPFAGPLQLGIDQLVYVADPTLLLGLDMTIEAWQTGYYLASGAPSIDPALIRLDREFRILPSDPASDHPYIVFSVEAHRRRDDWRLVPAVSQSYASIRAAFLERARTEATENAYKAFVRCVLESPDLLPEDAVAIIRRHHKNGERAA